MPPTGCLARAEPTLPGTSVARYDQTEHARSSFAVGPQIQQSQGNVSFRRLEIGSILARVGRFFGIREGHSQAPSLEDTDLLKQFRHMEDVNKRLSQRLEGCLQEIAAMKSRHTQQLSAIRKLDKIEKHFQSMQQEAQIKEDRFRQAMQQEAQTKEHHFRQAVAHIQDELKRSNADVASLQKRVAEDEAKLSKVCASAVTTLAQDVSRDVPDDVVKSDISKFFQGEFFSWCADTCATRVAQEESVASFLHSIGIINSTQDYENAPQDLKFDMDLPDGSSPLVLLQAVLSAVLCETFLTNPFFLAEETADSLKEFETALSIGEVLILLAFPSSLYVIANKYI